MKKFAYLGVVLALAYYFYGDQWLNTKPQVVSGETRISKAQFHQEVKKLFHEKQYDKVVKSLRSRLESALPENLKRQYHQLIQLAEKLQPAENKSSTPQGKNVSRGEIELAQQDNLDPEREAEAERDLASTASMSTEQKYSTWKRLVNTKPRSKAAYRIAYKVSQLARKKKDDFVLRNALSILFLKEKNRTRRDNYRKELDKLNQKLVFSPEPSPATVTHEVKAGEYLSKIGAKYNCPWRFIVKVNNLGGPNVRVGDTLKVLDGERKILVNKKEFTLTLLVKGVYIKQYRVALGKNGCTPVGTFVIRTKQMKPKWTYKGRTYAYGHPDNELGTRWMGFKNTPRHRGYGIHGTKYPESIGTNASRGCVRMINDQVNELFDMVPRKTKVYISE